MLFARENQTLWPIKKFKRIFIGHRIVPTLNWRWHVDIYNIHNIRRSIKPQNKQK